MSSRLFDNSFLSSPLNHGALQMKLSCVELNTLNGSIYTFLFRFIKVAWYFPYLTSPNLLYLILWRTLRRIIRWQCNLKRKREKECTCMCYHKRASSFPFRTNKLSVNNVKIHKPFRAPPPSWSIWALTTWPHLPQKSHFLVQNWKAPFGPSAKQYYIKPVI